MSLPLKKSVETILVNARDLDVRFLDGDVLAFRHSKKVQIL